VIDGMLKDGLWDVYNDFHMGMCAELCADQHSISREEQVASTTNLHELQTYSSIRPRYLGPDEYLAMALFRVGCLCRPEQ
jgi:hypothetical protein